MIFPQLPWLTIVAPLCLRLMVGAIYLTSGWRHMKDPAARCKDIGISKRFTLFLGAAELAGALGAISGVLIQPAAAGLILLMAGAIEKKILVWQTGFWGSTGTNGWSYDFMLLVMNFVIATTGGGSIGLPFPRLE